MGFDFIRHFTSSSWFNDTTDKVYHITSSVVNTKGKLVKTYVDSGEIVEKVIRPATPADNKDKTIKIDAIMNVPARLQFFSSENTSDLIKWQNRYYRIVTEWNRADQRNYGYRYGLEYLNRDAEINGKLS